MKIDIILNEFTSARENAELSALAESYGVRAVWSASYASERNPFMSLVGAADTTKKVRLGPLAVSPMEMHPLIMCNSLLTLNEMSGGRAMIAVGGGGGVLEAMAGKRKKLAENVGECIEILRGATANEVLNYDGEFYQVKDYQPRRWATDTPPQIYVAAGRPKMINMATRLADGLMGSDLVPSMIRKVAGLAEKGLAEHSRSGEPFAISNFWAWHIKEDKEEAMREARRELILRGMLYPNYTEVVLEKEESDLVQKHMGAFWRAFGDRSGNIQGVPEDIVNKLIDRISSTGDLNDIDREIERMKELEAAGLNEIALRVHDDPATGIKLIGEHIVPAVQ